jgi:hypothetical protein
MASHRRFAYGLALLLVVGTAAHGGGVDDAGPPTPAAPACGTYDNLRILLGDRFGERPTSAGLADDGTLMQLFASTSAGTWTMVNVDPSGRACVLATGRDWQDGRAAQGRPA